MELWDVYDINRNKTGKVIDRHGDEKLKDGEYHLVTEGIIINDNGEILVTRRAASKHKYALMWECTGGSCVKGEDTLQGILRELSEEIGLKFKAEDANFLKTIRDDESRDFKDIWIFRKNIEPKDLEFRDGEVIDAKLVTIDEFETMCNNKEIVPTIDFTREDYEMCQSKVKSEDDKIKKNEKYQMELVDEGKTLIRKVRYEDIEQIVDINIKDWKKAYKGIIDDVILDNLDRNNKIEKWRKSYKIGNVIVAEKNGKVLGYCRYDDNAAYENTDIDSEIIALYVDYDNLGSGIGRKLVEYVMNDLRSKNKTKMIIWCLEKNENGRKFYEKMGGKLLQEEKYFEKDGKKYKEVGYIYDIK